MKFVFTICRHIFSESEVPDNVVRKLMSPRQQVFMELLQTESNYVGILQTIVAVSVILNKYMIKSIAFTWLKNIFAPLPLSI